MYCDCDVARPPVVEAPHAEAGGVQEAVAVPGGGEGPQPLAGSRLRPPVDTFLYCIAVVIILLQIYCE